jgi:threonine dehydrogenase-like Zn-dependent dehydrogenase
VRAVALHHGRMHLRDDIAAPVPGFGQALVRVRACGICGSDLHFAQHGVEMVALADEVEGLPDLGAPPVDLDRDVFMGHEFSAELLELGPDTVGPEPGSIVTSIPILLTTTGIRPIVYSNDVAAGYGEQMLLSAPMLLSVPNGLDPHHAALTEPMAVGLHAVNRSEIGPRAGAVVLGCGPVGLAVIAALRLRGIEPVVASDYSAGRRAIALAMGAHEVVDPAFDDAFAVWRRTGGVRDLVVYEAIGVPGILDTVARLAPPRTRLLVVGVCMQADTVHPFFGISKELEVRFALAYEPTEFADTLRHLAEGAIDVTPMITAEVGLDGVEWAFDALADPDEHCKILVVP